MLQIIILNLLLTLPILALAQSPIPHQGDFCPTGTYRSGDYCKPIKSDPDQVIIQKSGSACRRELHTARVLNAHITECVDDLSDNGRCLGVILFHFI
jgi:hypothetical protein